MKKLQFPSLDLIGKAFKLLYASSPSLSWVKVSITLIQSVLPVLQLVLLKKLVDALTAFFVQNGHPVASEFWKWTILFCIVTLVWRVLSVALQALDDIIRQRLLSTLYHRVHTKAISLDMPYFDKPEYFDTLHRAQQEASSRPMELIEDLFNAFSAAVTLLGIFAVVCGMNIWVGLLLILLGIPLLITRLGRSKKMFEWRRDNTSIFRKTAYLDRIISSRESAKEVRIFDQGDFLKKRFVRLRKDLISAVFSIVKKRASLELFAVLFEISALAGVLFLLFRQLGLGGIGVGGFVMVFESFRKGQSTVLTMVTSLASYYSSRLSLVHLFDFLDLPEKKPTSGPTNTVRFPEQVRSIEFRAVYFRYPDNLHWAVENLSFKAEVGKIILLKGLNGAGKSTILKLIARLYEAEQGEILINGIPITQFSTKDYLNNLGVILQDFVQYNFSLEDNIRLGRKPMPEAWRDRVAEISGVSRILPALPQGYATPLGKMFQGGHELSMGQWQSVALMRALWTDPQVLLLDEPSGWMDASKEDVFLAALPELAQNKILILSHHAPLEFLQRKLDVQVIQISPAI